MRNQLIAFALTFMAASYPAQAGYQGLPKTGGGGGGSVTGVTATAPIVSSGGTAPVISCITATGSAKGCISAADWTTFNNKGSGTVTSESIVSANGFAGTVANATTTPALTITTTITGMLKGNGTAISAATSGTDYVVPSGSITGSAAAIAPTVQAKSAAFTAAQGFVYYLTGSNYAVTLPDATTTTQPLKFIVGSAPIEASGPITFIFTGGQVVNPGGFTTYGLYTKGEILELTSDGANFISTIHKTDSAPSTGLSITPVGFGTISSLTTHYTRIGGVYYHLWAEWTVGTTTAAVASVTLPSTMAIDSTAYSSSTQLEGFFNAKTTAQVQIGGSQGMFRPYYDNSATGTIQLAYYTKTNDFLGLLANAGAAINGNKAYFDATFIASGLRP